MTSTSFDRGLLSSSLTHPALRRHTLRWTALLMAVDALAFLASAYVASGVVDHQWSFHHFVARLFGSSIIFIAIWLVIFERLGLYRRSIALSARDEFYSTVVALSIGILPQLLLFTLVPTLSTSRLVLLTSLAVAIIVVGGARAVVYRVRDAVDARDRGGALIVGPPQDAAAVRRALGSHHRAVFATENSFALGCGNSAQAVLTRLAWFREARKFGCDAVMLTAFPGAEAVSHLMRIAGRMRTRIAFAVPGFEFRTYGLQLTRDGSQAIVSPLQATVCAPWVDALKRFLDIMVAAIALLVLSPLLAAAALAVYLDSGAPVLFRQERVGRDGESFFILKLRTMCPGAGEAWVAVADARITRIGAFLRRTSIDELPQLINVLRGEMSIVGPRPEMRDYAEDFSRRIARYDERHLVRPGITGWAQVQMKRNLAPSDAEEVLAHDLFYIENWSMFLDLTVIFKTAVELLLHRAV